MTIEESAKDLLRKLRDAWVMRLVEADDRMLFECKHALQAQRDDMREMAAKLIKEKYEYIHCSDEIAKDIENLK